ncbi:MAG TPA: histidine--tRNA ligase [Gammaproteobacteria bacterium]|nr:histidine--tRNA ligase [Gammaproteobacteria bacterium]
MAELIQPVRGMNDILSAAAPLWERLETAAARIFRAYGYTQVRLPVLERTELFSRSIGELTDIVEKEMYTFEDRNGDSLTLRPEATASVVRACLSNGLLHNQQQKLWTAGPMFRREKPQKGRYRQFHQLSVEALGYAEPETDAELIMMSARLWQALGIAHVSLELNSLGTPESRSAYRELLTRYLRDNEAALDADSRRRLERNPMRILDSKNPDMQPLLDAAPQLGDHLDTESLQHFDRVRTLLDDARIEYTINPRLVRGLDYYTRTVFEWVTDRLGSQSAVCSGGRYDGLVAQLGGRDTPAVGWALGIERVVELLALDAGEETPSSADLFIACAGDAARRFGFACAETLRGELPQLRVAFGLAAAGLKAQLRRADRCGARFALIIGDDELAAAEVSVKPLLSDAPQRRMPLPELIAELRESGAAAGRAPAA